MKLNIFVFIFLLLSLPTAFADRDSSTLCRQYKNTTFEAEVCLNIPNDWDKKDVVYYLHGSGGNGKSWDTDPYFQSAMKIMQNQNLQRPLIVTISFGQWWILKDFGDQGQPSILEAYIQLQRDTEKEIFKDKQPRRRILFGQSMGGFNSILLMAKTNLQFDRLAILCPGFAVIGPYSAESEVQSYIERNKPYVNANLIKGVLHTLKMEFPTPDLWERHAPLTIVGNLKNRAETQFYILGNTQDEYGFGEGANLLQFELKKMNLNVAYEVIPGKHCTLNPKSIAAFLK